MTDHGETNTRGARVAGTRVLRVRGCSLAFGTDDAARAPVIFAAFVFFPLCVFASRAADAAPSRREIPSLLSKEPQ
jgi:hypothetical protein